MSLQGTFDVFSLPELLRMLAASSKSGALIVEAGGIAGRVDLRDGECVAAETAELCGAVASHELHARLVDVCFAVVRESTGAFRFAAGEPPSFDCDATVAVEPVLAEVELLVAEWRELTARIPSLDVRPVLVAELAGDSITLQANEWALLARFDGYTTVRDLVDARRRSLVEVCRAVADLVERGAITLVDGTPAIPRATYSVGDAMHDSDPYAGRLTPVAPYGPGIDLAPEPDAAADFGVSAEEHSDTKVAVDLDGRADAAAPPEPAAWSGEAGETTAVPAATDVETAPVEALPEPDVDAGLAALGHPALVPDGADDGDPRDRGAILRLFSALREG